MTWMSWQIDYLLFLQNIRELTHGIFDSLFLCISDIGIAPFTLMAMCAIYWGINKRLGIYMIYCSCFSYLMNIFLKFTFCIYRPWILDNRVHPPSIAFETAPGYSFPSGHTSGAVSFWGSIGMYFKNKKWVVIPCLLIILLIMFSRNYLGVHTPQDVIVSFIVGIFIIFFAQKILKYTEEKKEGNNILMLGITIACVLLASYLLLKSYPVDYKDGVIVYDVTSAKYSAIARIINVFAMIFGCFLETKFINFNPLNGNLLKRIIVVIIGLIIVFSINHYSYHFLEDIADSQTAHYIINFVLGFFITFIYPCFIKLISSKLN